MVSAPVDSVAVGSEAVAPPVGVELPPGDVLPLGCVEAEFPVLLALELADPPGVEPPLPVWLV